MHKTIVLAALFCATTAAAQLPASRGAPVASINDGLIKCLSLPDGTRARLDCFDAVIAPLSKTKPTPRDVANCRYYTEQDQRLACFDDFAHSITRPSRH